MHARIISRLNEIELGYPIVRQYIAQDLLNLVQAFQYKTLPKMRDFLNLWNISMYEEILSAYGFNSPMSLSMLDRKHPIMPNLKIGPRLKLLFISVLMYCLDCSG